MDAAEDDQAPRPILPRRRVRRVLVAAGVLTGAAATIAWLERVPIATHFVDRTFAAKGVRARYGISDLGFGRQRLTDVVIGDPASPDLVADWIETRTDIGIRGATLTGVRAGHVRMRARLGHGKVSLGAIDRLLPASSGRVFALPAIDLAVADARVRLETPQGPVGIRLSGSGRLDDGFRGQIAAVAPALVAGGCRIAGAQAALRMSIAKGAPHLAGPVRSRAVACAGTAAQDATAQVDATLSPALDAWRGSARVALADLGSGTTRLAAARGTIGFAGDARRTAGRVDLIAARFAADGARGRQLALNGTWRVAGARATLAGRVSARHVAVATGAALDRVAASARGTPVGPLVAALAQAVTRAARDVDVTAALALSAGGGATLATIERVAARSASGAALTFTDGALVLGHPAGVRIAGVAQVAGGRFPRARIALAQAAPGAGLSGSATFAPFATRDARLALAPVRFGTARDGAIRVTTAATLSGPLGDGRVERLEAPLDLRVSPHGAVALAGGCMPVSFARLAVAGLALHPARLALCPLEGALLVLRDGRANGGVRIAAPRLAGTLGNTPLTLAASGAQVRIGAGGFVVTGLAARVGDAARVSRLDLSRVTGTFDARGLAGTFGGGAGQIGNVPLLLSAAGGDWALVRGRLALRGAMTVGDAAPTPRFKPLAARDVTLSLADGTIVAKGALFEPAKAVKVADVTLRHDLSRGAGTADLAVPGIVFGDALQPEALTPLTFGVIADVKGIVSGEGHIAWTAQGVTSTGMFRTPGTDLAAAFGPVTGLKGEIRFTDLLALESAPGQVAMVGTINPGVPVSDGRIVYRTLADQRVAVDSGRWPFAGGTLTLEPTLLDFSAAQSRKLTFRVDAMDAGQFLQQFDFKNLNATGVFDGKLPMVFDESGGRIENGQLAVRAGGGALAYVGDLTEKDLGVWGNLAFQALRSLQYRNLAITMNGPLAGEMVTGVRFAGITQGKGAKGNFLVRRLQKLPFVFNITIRAPFRGLIDSAASFYDPKRLVQRNLQALIGEQNRKAAVPPSPTPAIQPPASEKVP